MLRIMEQVTGSGKTVLPAVIPYYEPDATPREMNLPHDAWREHQHESLEWVIGDDEPGSVVALCQTLFLQESNYEGEYSFDVHKGRRHFDCIHPEAPRNTKAHECKHADEGMRHCKHYSDCPYVISKQIAAGSVKCSLNYAYWLASNWGKKHPPRWLFLDEAHILSEIVTGWAGCTITAKDAKDWKLPEFPTIGKQSNKTGSLFGPRSPAISPTRTAIDWLHKCRAILAPQYAQLRRNAQNGNAKARKQLAECERIGRKVRNCYDALAISTNAWYVRSGASALQYGRKVQPGFMAKPLTAKNHFSSLFMDGYNTVAMSATIGDFDIFAEELGVSEFVSRVVPSRFPPERRPIYVLDAPKMGYSKKESERERELKFEHQADMIADFIKQWPWHWCGLIHVTRKIEERILAERLWKRGLEDRVWYIPGHDEHYIPTNAQLIAWENRKRQVPNSILVTCSFSEGYNGLDEKINVSAKVPFPVWGAPGTYENKWSTYNRKRYNMTAARKLAQQQGRNRRGQECDYDTADEVRGANAIVDASISRVKNMLPDAVREALMEL